MTCEVNDPWHGGIPWPLTCSLLWNESRLLMQSIEKWNQSWEN